MTKDHNYIRVESQLKMGECTKVMKQIPDGSVDCIITDPPYNLGLFMQKRNTNLGKMRENQFAYAGWDNLEYGKWRKSMSRFLTQCHTMWKSFKEARNSYYFYGSNKSFRHHRIGGESWILL